MAWAAALATAMVVVLTVATLITCPTRTAHNQLDLLMPDPMLKTFFPMDSAWSIVLTGCLLDTSAPNLVELAQGISSLMTLIIAMISKRLSVM